MNIVSDIGDRLFAAMELMPTPLVAPGYYATMGFGVPAGISAQVATGQRSLILVGDGAFQMTGWELGNCPRLGLDPIVILLNNQTWEMIRAFQTNRAAPRWATGTWPTPPTPWAGAATACTTAQFKARWTPPTPSAGASSSSSSDGAAGRQHAHAAALLRRHPRAAARALPPDFFPCLARVAFLAARRRTGRGKSALAFSPASRRQTMPDFTLTIGGQNVAGAARPIPVIDPSTGQAFTESPAATVAQPGPGGRCRRPGLATWQHSSHAERSAALERVAVAIEQHAAELADLVVREQGKPWRWRRWKWAAPWPGRAPPPRWRSRSR